MFASNVMAISVCCIHSYTISDPFSLLPPTQVPAISSFLQLCACIHTASYIVILLINQHMLRAVTRYNVNAIMHVNEVNLCFTSLPIKFCHNEKSAVSILHVLMYVSRGQNVIAIYIMHKSMQTWQLITSRQWLKHIVSRYNMNGCWNVTHRCAWHLVSNNSNTNSIQTNIVGNTVRCSYKSLIVSLKDVLLDNNYMPDATGALHAQL